MEPKYKRADKAFEQFLLLATILSSVLYQFVIWLIEKPIELNGAVAFTIVFSIPLLLALFFWINVILEGEINEKSIKFRLVAWGSANAGLVMNLMVLATVVSLGLINFSPLIQVYFWSLSFAVIIPFLGIINKATKYYKSGRAGYFPMWKKPWRFLAVITFFIEFFIMMMILVNLS